MSARAALTLYPLWAVAVLVGITALRLGRDRGRGLVALCFALAVWVTGLVLWHHPATAALAERVLPAGMLVGGAFIHAAHDLIAPGRRWPIYLGYGWGAAVALVGAVAPHLYYEPGLTAAGPLFWPVAALAAAGTALTVGATFRAARAVTGRAARRRTALALGSLCGTVGGGGAVGAHILGLADIAWAAPPLLGAVLLFAYAILSGEHGRARRLVQQGLVYALMTAALSAFGLVAFFALLPELAPGAGASLGWLLAVTFCAALPLDAARNLLVETVGRRLFREPIGVRDLADQVARTESRADQAERLAAIGTMASAVAHEIRNPLGIITAQAVLLERRGADPAQVAQLRAQIDRASRFIDDLLRYGKPRPLAVTSVRIADAIAGAIASVRGAAVEPTPPIELELGAVEAVDIDADASAVHDVHAALVHNAVAALHGRAGGRIAVRGALAGGAVEIAIEDNGPGVPAEIEDRLFEPFVTGRGRDAAHPGTGLGLAICARWLERHGGTVRHERPAEGGARFVVRWPRLHG